MTGHPDRRERETEQRIAAPPGVAVKVCGITRVEDARLAAALGASALGFVFWRRSPRALPVESAAAIVRELPPFVAAVGVFVNQPIAEVIDTARRVPLDVVQLHGEEPPEYVAALPGRLFKAVPASRREDAAGEPTPADGVVESADDDASRDQPDADSEAGRARAPRPGSRGASVAVAPVAFGTARAREPSSSARPGEAMSRVGAARARETGRAARLAGTAVVAAGPGRAGDVLAWPPHVVPLVDAADPVRRGGTGRAADWELARRLAAARPIVLAGGLDASNVRRAVEYVRPWAVDVSSGVEARPGVKDPDRLRAFFASLETAGLLARVAHARFT